MTESLRILKLLFYKNLLTRKRQWKISLIGEILIPVGLIVCVWTVRNLSAKPPTHFENNTYFNNVSKENMLEDLYYSEVSLYFTPNNSFTKLLMQKATDCLRLNPDNITINGYATEEELVHKYQETKIAPLAKMAAVVFDDQHVNESTKHLSYKIRTSNLILHELFNIFLLRNMYMYYTSLNMFVPLQICIDESFLALKAETTTLNSQMFVQRIPYPPYTQSNLTDSIIRQLFAAVIIIAFMLPLFIETSKASSEKFFGIHILMSMNGVSNALNLFSWLTSGIVFINLFCIIPIVIILLFSTGDALPYVNYTNPLIVWLALTFHIAHLFSYGVHVSAYFSKFLLVIFGLLALNICTAVLQLHGLREEDYPLAPYLGILFPNMLLNRIIEELNYYETTGEGVQWNNLFSVGNSLYKIGGSTGMILLFSLIGMVFHFVMAIYIYAINPGKYGVKKHPLFFLQTKSKTNIGNRLENLEYDDGIDKRPFESVSKRDYEPGIQIRNLKKSYNISLFSKTQIHALRGVSVDFYKGQITSLLGHNGAGKTTMMSILTGMMSPSDGLILINSKNITDHATEIMNNMGLCPQENILFPCLSVEEQLLFFAMLKGTGKSKSDVKHSVKVFLEKLQLHEKRNSLPKELSGGQKRRVCIGMALIGDSSTLILDEPTSGLDPKSKRIIWDILLRMRGEKTILISTHDMEEADILGDRIAIMHAGNLKSYGTAMYLKKLLGQDNVEVTLSIEPHCDFEKLSNELNCKGNIINKDGNRVVISVPNSPNLPDWLDKLENSKAELGVSGLSVSLITLEQVFLKVTQEHQQAAKPYKSYNGIGRKLMGGELQMQYIRAMLHKKMIYTKNNFSTIIIMIFLVLIALLSISLILKETNVFKPADKLVPIKLNMYNDPQTYYKSDDLVFGQKYKLVSESWNGEAAEAQETNLNDALIKYAKRDIVFYNNHLIAAAEFNKTNAGMVVNALYSEKAVYSFPISVNLLSNAIIKGLLGDNYSISLSSQHLPSLNTLIYTDNTTINAFTTAVVFVLLFFPTIALFVLQPLRESLAGVKQLQRMAGVSGFTYWATNFIFDAIVFLFIIALIMIGFVSMAYFLDLQMYEQKEILISVLLFVVFAINSLPLVYIFSFMNAATSSVVRLLTYIPMGLVSMELIMCAVNAQLSDYQAVKILRPIQKRIFLLIPYLSFFHSQISFYTTAQKNSRCKRMPNEFYDTMCYPNTLNPDVDICCQLKCRNGKCEDYLKYFTNFETDITLEESLIYLSLTPIIYFGILVVLESQIIPKMMAAARKPIAFRYKMDERVKKEKLSIADRISTIYRHNASSKGTVNLKMENNSCTFQEHSSSYSSKSNQVFLVYELRKQYRKLLAVKDVSFGVYQHECFGLLGVNGAGKSTTFRMMTGGEIPNSGIMCIGDKSIKENRGRFLSQMGYCPQNDAIISSLNAFDHLRLFASIRGIQKHNIEQEVRTWIDRLNLNACAFQPSGTYSGGNKRRLNIAMALIGNPNLVLLDEPTTGVDPGARRSLWNVIQTCQTMGQAVVLTSHSMEECEALCNRLGIMVGGILVCIGPSQELKQRFGAGYDIQLKLNPQKSKDQIKEIKYCIMNCELNFELVDENSGYLMYHVTPDKVTWRKMYDIMNEMKAKYDCIDDFSVVSSTLEQLFLLFARAADKERERKSE